MRIIHEKYSNNTRFILEKYVNRRERYAIDSRKILEFCTNVFFVKRVIRIFFANESRII